MTVSDAIEVTTEREVSLFSYSGVLFCDCVCYEFLSFLHYIIVRLLDRSVAFKKQHILTNKVKGGQRSGGCITYAIISSIIFGGSTYYY